MWLHVPEASTSSRSAPGVGDSTSALNWRYQALEQFAWSRGKPMPSRLWLKQCSKAPWLQRLFGQMSEPSAAAHGVESWISSLAESRASHTASPVKNLGKTTSEISGPKLAELSCNPARGACLSKTSAACCRAEAPSAFTETFAALVSRLRRDYSQRQSAARRRTESGYSSSRWQTPSVADAMGGRLTRSGPRNNEPLLRGQAKMLCSRLDPTKSTSGPPSLERGQTLNLWFVEALMGWPAGLSACECSAMELSRWKVRMRFAISRLPLPTRAPEVQADLFG